MKVCEPRVLQTWSKKNFSEEEVFKMDYQV